MLFLIAITKTAVGQKKRKGMTKTRVVQPPIPVAASDEQEAIAKFGDVPEGCDLQILAFTSPSVKRSRK